MRMHSVSHQPPSHRVLANVSMDVAKVYPKLVDADASTCEFITRGKFTNIAWFLPNNRTSNYFRVYMKGTQQCQDVNTAWFMTGRMFGLNMVECDVRQEQNGAVHVCDITCLCPCGMKCDFLHLQLQFPPWMTKSIALCFYEHQKWNKLIAVAVANLPTSSS